MTVDGSVVDTLAEALRAVQPAEDLADLAVRFRGVSPEEAQVVCDVTEARYKTNDTRNFIISNQDTSTQLTITAQLKYVTDYVYMWVETSPRRVNLNATNLRRAADRFTDDILPTMRAFFGDEARPGVDCDPHIYILHATGLGSSVGGYFSSPDGFTRAVRPDSNEAEMFVVHAERGYNGANPGSESYMSTLAHELQHMISRNMVHASDLWLEEGAAQLAERLSGYGDTVSTVYSFAAAPDTQLNTWSESSAGENSAHYGAGYLFWAYLYDRFGSDVTQQLARTPERNIQSLLKTLGTAGVVNPSTNQPYTFAEMFADFVVANYMGTDTLDTEQDTERYRYTETDVPPMSLYDTLTESDVPYEKVDQVNQFGTHYIELSGNTPQTLKFTGSTTVPLLPFDDADSLFWWSNRGDASNPRLTREFDLSKVQNATLRYRAWYRIEVDYDYGYVSASTDNGRTWQIVKSSSCTTTNPNGSNLGCGYNGSSGVRRTPEWVDEVVDLSDYAGQKVLIRFEMVTDAGVNREGIAIDNIEIPEIGFVDNAESNSGWNAEGFILANNTLPQFWQVQLLITNQAGQTRLERVTLENNSAEVLLDFGADDEKARRVVVAISATTPVTTEPGSYELRLR